MLAVVLFIVVTTIRNHQLINETVSWNKHLGVPMSCKIGWFGVTHTKKKKSRIWCERSQILNEKGPIYLLSKAMMFASVSAAFWLQGLMFVEGLRTRWSKEREGPYSGTEPYDARVSRTVSLRRVWYHHLSGPTSGPRRCIPTHLVHAHRSLQEVGRLS